jgi:hypothetical protein
MIIKDIYDYLHLHNIGSYACEEGITTKLLGSIAAFLVTNLSLYKFLPLIKFMCIYDKNLQELFLSFWIFLTALNFDMKCFVWTFFLLLPGFWRFCSLFDGGGLPGSHLGMFLLLLFHHPHKLTTKLWILVAMIVLQEVGTLFFWSSSHVCGGLLRQLQLEIGIMVTEVSLV